jgi:hypothetical protein
MAKEEGEGRGGGRGCVIPFGLIPNINKLAGLHKIGRPFGVFLPMFSFLLALIPQCDHQVVLWPPTPQALHRPLTRVHPIGVNVSIGLVILRIVTILAFKIL